MNDSYALLLVDALNKLADKMQQAIVYKYLTQGKYMNITGCLTGRFQTKVPNDDCVVDAKWLDSVLHKPVESRSYWALGNFDITLHHVACCSIIMYNGPVTRKFVRELAKLFKLEHCFKSE